MTEGARARALHSAGQLDAAARMYQQALAVSPDDISLRRDFAVLLMQSGREADAAALLDPPQIVDAADADLLSILALCLRATGRYPRALEIAGKASAADPRNPLCWMLLGSVMLATGTPVGAEPALRRAIALEPGFAEAWHYLGESLQAQRRWQEAIQAYRHAAAQQPTEIINIALCQAMAGRTDLALRDFETAHRLMPGRADVLAQLAHCQAMLCLHDAQLASTHELTTLLAAGNPAGVEPEPFLLSTLDIPETLKADAIRRYSGRIARPALASAPRPATQDPARGGRIRIGYLSADFGEHAIGSLVRGHFAAHDRNRFEVVGYSLTTAEALADEIIQGFDTLVDASLLDDDALAQRIIDDGISVLIDMTGFTLGARPGVLARRPAHLQWGWLGFIHGQQAPWLDGLLLDAHVQPAGAAWIYDDHPIQLQGSLFPASPMQRGVRDRARFGLPEEAVVLASFNNTYKLSGDLIDSWSHVLAQADQAHLMVYVPPLARAGFLQRWQLSGGELERLHLVDKIELEAQADRAASCDLFLDAFRYQAGATALHAIANDLPLLCLEGHQPLARLGMGLNRFLGMDELICPDIDTYVERAVKLAHAPAQLSALRQCMRQQVADRQLFDARRAASTIEAAILQQLDR